MSQSSPCWHALPPDEVLRELASSSDGLSEPEWRRRLAHYGPNRFRRTPPASVWRILVSQIRNVVVGLLVAGATVALLTGDVLDAAAIGAVLLLNVAIGFTTELRAHRAMEALVALEVARARVLRAGLWREVDARDLVPGDVIHLESGQTIPADARLLEASELRVVEASLTGEPAPAKKRADLGLAADVPLPDRVTMVYKATTVAAGRGKAAVVATGMATEVGRIGALAGAVEDRSTPLERRLDALGRRLALLALAVAALVALLGYGRGAPAAELIQTAIALAVAAVPEGLPVVATIAMAVGVRRMARRHALVRRLPVVETLGSATLICTDKTGTLTAGKMTATVLRLADREVQVGADGTDPRVSLALRIGALANEASLGHSSEGWRAHGDPTDVALLLAAARGGVDRERLLLESPRHRELPFSSERLLAASWHHDGPGLTLFVKGAPGRVLELSDRVLTAHGTGPLTAESRDSLLEANRELAARGLRVLALAMKEDARGGDADLQGLTWVAFVGLSDPPAAGVRETIEVFSRAGIRTVMITGDQHRTAEALARELGLARAGDRVLDGRELDRMSDDELRSEVDGITAYSRASPEAKLRIIAAHQARGAVVAMLGDGVNDTAALRQADIGVAMGMRGTDMAKEAADLILEDDRFPTIGAAVEEGRVIFDNIRKFVFYLFSCNLAEIFVLLGAGFAGVGPPLLPLQILWLNLITDTFPALALAVEPGDRAVMRQPPRDPAEAILHGAMLSSIGMYAALIAAVTIVAYANAGTTGAFMTLALAQILHLGNARSAGPVLTPRFAFANRAALGAAVLALGLQLLAAFLPPLAQVLRVGSLSTGQWVTVALLGSTPAVVGQLIKLVRSAGGVHRQS
ncbi:MAG: cation-translocating P-type ATPase [Gemmatimonadales bacterium]